MIKWNNIPGFNGYYMASNFGEIKSLDRIINGKKYKGIILKQKTNKYGYNSVVLSVNSKRKTFLVHKLIAMSFMKYIAHSYNKEIDHIDGIKTNNKLSNLQIITRSKNIRKRKKILYKNIGASFEKNRKMWRSDCCIDGKHKFLGYFNSKNEAGNAYIEYYNKINRK